MSKKLLAFILYLLCHSNWPHVVIQLRGKKIPHRRAVVTAENGRTGRGYY